MAIPSTKAVIGSEYLSYGGVNQIWTCTTSSTTTTKTIANDPGDLGISNPYIFVKFTYGIGNNSQIIGSKTYDFTAFGKTGVIRSVGIWGTTYVSYVKSGLVIPMYWDGANWTIPGETCIGYSWLNANDYDIIQHCYANGYKTVDIRSGNPNRYSFVFPYPFKSVDTMCATVTLKGNSPKAACVTAIDTSSITVDFAYEQAGGKIGYVHVSGV